MKLSHKQPITDIELHNNYFSCLKQLLEPSHWANQRDDRNVTYKFFLVFSSIYIKEEKGDKFSIREFDIYL